MIYRMTTPEVINHVSNMPGVRENVCYREGDMDWAEALQCSDLIALTNGTDACALFAKTAERQYQVHTMFAPSCRGSKALAAGREMLAWMRPHADTVWGATPLKNCAARWFNRQLGAMPISRDFFHAEGEVEVFELRLS